MVSPRLAASPRTLTATRYSGGDQRAQEDHQHEQVDHERDECSMPAHSAAPRVRIGGETAVADETVDSIPELRTPKVAEKALISIPPFKAVGNIHLLAERNLQESLAQ